MAIKYNITAHPINRKLQQELGIYDGYSAEKGNCKSISVGKVVAALVKDGCTKINSYYDAEKDMIVMHLSAR